MSRSHLLSVYAQLPIEIVRAQGALLYTRDGRELVDFYGGHAVMALGYGHPRWTARLAEQAERLAFQTNAVPLEERERAARRLVEFAALGLEHVFFVNSGAEANENALRIGLRYTARSQIVAVEGGFHGRTAAAAAATYGALDRWYGFPRAPFDVAFLPRDDASAIEEIVSDATAAVIVEPVQGLGGARDLGRDYLQRLRRRCETTGALLIFDEVQCGMGRTGFPFAANRAGVRPDMLTTAKALAGGFPAGALLIDSDIAAALAPGELGTTFGGGPLACALIEAVIDAIESDGLLAHAREAEARVRSRCVRGPVEAIQGAGLLLGLRTRPSAREIQHALLAQGFLTGTSSDPHILRLLPPLNIELAQIDRLADALGALE